MSVTSSRLQGGGFLAIVPIRAGSKGLPGKNTQLLNGRPLYQHAVEQGLAAGAERVIISTDIDVVLHADHGPSVVTHERPGPLAGDDTPMDAVLTDVLSVDGLGNTDVVLLQATSPLRTPTDVVDCVELLRRRQHDLVLTAALVDSGPLKYGTRAGTSFEPVRSSAHTFANRQTLPQLYRPNGAVFAFSRRWFLEHGSLAAERIGMIEMPPERSIDIDTAADLERCEQQLVKRGGT